MYLLDTNICMYIMNNHPKEVIRKCKAAGVGNIGISSVTTSELYYGVYKSQKTGENRKRLEEFLKPFTIIPYNEDVSLVYGKIRADFEKEGNLIGSLDMLIAAHALSKGLILVTNNTKEFKKVKFLKIENWVIEK